MSNDFPVRDPQSETGNPNSAFELHDDAGACAGSMQPSELNLPEPWSHPWHDQLGLLYHEAIAERLRKHPELRDVAVANIKRWTARNDYPPSVLHAFQQWCELLTAASIETLAAAMADPSEHGHRMRQNTPFAGILTQEERRRIRNNYEKATTH